MAARLDKHGAMLETALIFDIEGESVVGIVHAARAQAARTGIVFVVGGRQYRTGAQRQFVRLARRLAADGFAVLRFDLRGMGDSAASPRNFLDTGDDITAAIAELHRQVPTLERVLLWGLCDGASAAICHAAAWHVEEGVGPSKRKLPIEGVFMVNPWVTTEAGAARATLKHHYQKRIVSAGFWKRLLQGDISVFKSLCAFGVDLSAGVRGQGVNTADEQSLPDVVFDAMGSYKGRIAVITSKKDLTAGEFRDAYAKRYGALTSSDASLTFEHVEADHTFSTQSQHGRLEELTMHWCVRAANSVESK